MLPSNIEPFNVFLYCKGQVIEGFSGVVDMNLLAAERVMDWMKVNNKIECWNKIKILYDEFVFQMKVKGS